MLFCIYIVLTCLNNNSDPEHFLFTKLLKRCIVTTGKKPNFEMTANFISGKSQIMQDRKKAQSQC